MPTRIQYRTPKFHQGQAMVEYAILLILLVTLFVGGTELGLTSLASSKNTEAAKTGINEYAEINQQRLNILNAEKQYLISLAGAGCIGPSLLDSNADDIYETVDCSSTPSAGSITAANIVKLLDRIHRHYESTFPADGLDDGFEDISEFALSNIRLKLSGGQVSVNLNTNSEIGTDGDPCDTVDTCTDSDTDDAVLDVTDIQSIIDKETAISNQYNSPKKFIKLIILQHLKLALLPINISTDNDGNDTEDLSDAKLLLADLNTLTITPPSCGGTDGAYTYDDGLPSGSRYVYKTYLDKNGIHYIYQTGNTVYLFNPLPMDVSSCAGVDNQRGGKPRIRILIDGYTPPKSDIEDSDDFINLFVPGLPKLNQAMYSNYENVCVDAANSYVSCSSPNIAQRWLKPPGKICFNNVVDSVDSCPDLNADNSNLIGPVNEYGPTGFYFFANANDAVITKEDDSGRFQYIQNEPPEFRPAIQLECGATPDKNIEDIFEGNCNNQPSKIRIHTRYRRVFEGFLTFGLMTLANTNLLPYFYNPNQVGVAEHVLVGSHGSEVGPIGRNGRPSIKHFMDFRGCYEVDVETNQVSACN